MILLKLQANYHKMPLTISIGTFDMRLISCTIQYTLKYLGIDVFCVEQIKIIEKDTFDFI